jgi:metal-responsive CopG/Arc/MetJ family transcriptional regulator
MLAAVERRFAAEMTRENKARKTVDYPADLAARLERAAEEDGFPNFAELARHLAREYLKGRQTPSAGSVPV